MAENVTNNHSVPSSFYEKCTQDEENLQAKLRPILNQIQEKRVVVKELHIEFGVKFSGIVISYINRLEDLKEDYEAMIYELKSRENAILEMCNEVLESIKEQRNEEK